MNIHPPPPLNLTCYSYGHRYTVRILTMYTLHFDIVFNVDWITTPLLVRLRAYGINYTCDKFCSQVDDNKLVTTFYEQFVLILLKHLVASLLPSSTL